MGAGFSFQHLIIIYSSSTTDDLEVGISFYSIQFP